MAMAARHPQRPHRVPAGLYLRRRLAAVALLAGLVLAAIAAAAPLRSDAAFDGPPVIVVVGAGDTVWDLAWPHVPAGEDPRAYVVEVVTHNGVDSRSLRPGDVLELPSR